MDIKKEKKAIKNLKAFYMEDWNLTEEERDDLDNLVSRIVAVVKTEAQAVPKGFVLVPKEPTQEMIQAGLEKVRESWDDAPPDGFNSFTWGDMVATWKTMIEVQEPSND